MDDLSEALRELKIDRNAPDYKVEAAAKFTAISEESSYTYRLIRIQLSLSKGVATPV